MKHLYFILLLLPAALRAQPYESMFGQHSTEWLIEWRNLDIGGVDTVHVEKDTVIEGVTWKYIRFKNFLGYEGLLREDTMTGKVWYKGMECNDTLVKLAFDFSLNVGDSFDISNVWATSYSSNDKKVDTVYYVNGRKYIQFKGISYYGERMTFIEGVGGVMGIRYKQMCTIFMAPYLTCSYKDGIKTYSNKHYNGVCWLGPYTGLDDPQEMNDIKIYPNPVDQILQIKYPGSLAFDRIELIDGNGRIVFQSPYNSTINLTPLSAGLYFLRLTTRKGKTFVKTILKN